MLLYKTRASYVLKDSDNNNYVLLHLRNVLSDSAVKGKATIFTLETQNQLKGWNKSCRASGTLRANMDSHHQNGIAEHRIRTLSDSARTQLLHAMSIFLVDFSIVFTPFLLCNM